MSADDLLSSDNLDINSLREIKQTLVPHPDENQKPATLTAKSVLVSGEEE